MPAARSALNRVAFALIALCVAAEASRAESGQVEPEALRILERMTDYLGSLQRFSLRTESSIEEVLPSGQKIQLDSSAEVTIQRPDALRVVRRGEKLDQLIVYDGKTLSIEDLDAGYYAVAKAPADLDGLLHFARDTLDIVPPAGDFVFTNAFELLTASLSSGVVVGKSWVGGTRCDQLAFRNPVVDWQVWIADGDPPLPQKYVLTTRGDPAHPQYLVFMEDWNVAPKLDPELFRFTPAEGATRTEFLRAGPGS